MIEEIERLRSLLATSVAKECKCQNNIAVNQDVIKRNLQLKEENKKLRDCIQSSIRIVSEVNPDTYNNGEALRMCYKLQMQTLKELGGSDE